MRLVVFTGTDRDIALVGDDLDLCSPRKRLGKIVSELVTVAEGVEVVVWPAHVIFHSIPIPACSLCSGHAHEDEKHQKNNGARTETRRWVPVLLSPHVFQQF